MAKKQRNRDRVLETEFDRAGKRVFPILYHLAARIRPANSAINPRKATPAEAFQIMRETSEELKKTVQGKDIVTLRSLPLKDRKAILADLMIIGEFSRHIKQPLHEQYAEIPWRPLTDLRNALAHNLQNFTGGHEWNELCGFLISEFPRLHNSLEQISEIIPRRPANDDDGPSCAA